MDIRRQLRMIIEDKGYRQVAIAEKAGMTGNCLSMALRCERKLDANEFIAICGAIDMTPTEVAEYKR